MHTEELLPRKANRVALQLPGFSDAMEIDFEGKIHLSSAVANCMTNLAPLKRMTILRLESCGALMVAAV